MRREGGLLRVLVLPGLLLAGLLFWLGGGGREVRVEIPNGLSASETAALLKRERVIRSVFVFKAVGKLTGMDRALKPGEYVLRRGMSEPAALYRLYRGAVESARVVIPEGFMAKQIADRLEAAEVTGSAEFMAYVRKNELEGFLFPTTYLFHKGLPAKTVADHMVAEFGRHVRPVFDAAGQRRFTLKQIVTLASIVQREARVIEEMPTIASVYSNRLARKMRLEADPTVQYAMGKDTGEWFKGLRYKHLDNRSRYNTYLYSGLPPGPICSPGLDAVKAALNPAKTSFLYFVADNSGRHIFTATYADHNKARAKVKAEARRLKALEAARAKGGGKPSGKSAAK